MSLVRSIDRADLGGATVTLTTTAETVVLIGPSLQTPKDISTLVAIAMATVTMGTAATGLTLRLRQGTTVAGALIGSQYTQGGITAPVSQNIAMMASGASNFTDFAQWCLTAQQVSATGNGTVNAATMLIMSF